MNKYKDLHGAIPSVREALVIDILEGKGLPESPFHRDMLIITKEGNVLGKICPLENDEQAEL